MKIPLSYLFVPGNRPERFAKALASAAGAIILDLEDAVVVADKDRARAAVADWFAAHRDHAERIAVRINDAASPCFDSDLAMLRECGVRLVMLPKAEWPAQIEYAAARVDPQALFLPLVETARGVSHVDQIAAAPRVQRLVFGTLDYAVDLDLSGDPAGLAYPASRIAIASRCCELAAPVAGVTPDIGDDARLSADVAFARAFGFGAKLCIHPQQVGRVHALFSPSAAELDWASRVVAAAAGSDGAVALDGRMIDRPVVLRAESILRRHAP